MSNENAHSAEVISEDGSKPPQVALKNETSLPPNLDLGLGSASARRSSAVEPQIVEPDGVATLLRRAGARVGRPRLSEDEKAEHRREYLRTYRARKREEAGLPPSAPRSSGRMRKSAPDAELAELIREGAATFVTWALERFLGDAARPSREHAEGMGVPLANILLRHLPMPKEITPDLLDAAAFLVVATSYWDTVKDAVKAEADRRRAEHPPTSRPRPQRAASAREEVEEEEPGSAAWAREVPSA